MNQLNVFNHKTNIYFRPRCFCVYDVKVGESSTEMFAEFLSSDLSDHLCEFSQKGNQCFRLFWHHMNALLVYLNWL